MRIEDLPILIGSLEKEMKNLAKHGVRESRQGPRRDPIPPLLMGTATADRAASES